MPLPKPEVGLIVRYEYKFSSKKRRISGEEHPSCIMLAAPDPETGEMAVFYFAISHSKPDISEGEIGLELPAQVKRAAGLDAAPQWVLISECNQDTWAYGVQNFPHDKARYHYGFMPPGFFTKLKEEFADNIRSKRMTFVKR